MTEQTPQAYTLPYPPVPQRTQPDFGTAIFQLFRTPGGREFGVRVWAWTTLLTSIVYLIVAPIIAPAYLELFALASDPAFAVGNDPEAVRALFQVMGRIFLPLLLAMFGAWAAIAAGEAAMHKRMFLGVDEGRIPLRLDRHTFRVMGAQFCVWAIVFGIYFAAILLGLLTLGIGLIVTIPAGLAFMVIFALRYCSASALSVKDDTFRFGESKRVTQYRKGGLFGAYALIWVLGYVGMMFVQFGAMFAVLGPGGIETLASDLASETFDATALMERLNSPAIILLMVVGIVVYCAVLALWYLSMAGVGANAVLWYLRDSELPPTEWEQAQYTPPGPPAI